MRNRSHFFLFLSFLVVFTPVFAQNEKTVAKPGEFAEKKGYLNKDAQEALVPADNLDFIPRAVDTIASPTIIAFGSCNKSTLPQTMWQHVVANNPSLWIWLGDIVYADTTDLRALAGFYRKLKLHPEYKKLRAKAQIIGVYDDHDYGVNDGCRYYPMKYGSKKCLMNFLDVPLNSAVRRRDGAYQSYTFGKPGQRIKVIVLDSRWFRDSLVRDPTKVRRYIPNTTGAMLGEAQWTWLEKELRNSTAELNILCSSVQVIAEEHPYEKWANFPNERKRLLKLINTVKPKNLIILSGDRHLAEISKIQLDGLPYPLYDFTSSGLTHCSSIASEPNKYRVSNFIPKKNFGILKIRWEGSKPIVTMEIRGQQNELFDSLDAKF